MRVTYVFDPLCGWCYGAAPAISRISAIDGVVLELAPSGLFAGAASRVMDTKFAAYAWQSDQRIAELTGQPFSEAYRHKVLGLTGSRFDSTTASLAIVAAGLEAPDREFEVLKQIQASRYQEGLDITDPAVVADILRDAGIPAGATRLLAPDEQLLAIHAQRISSARKDMTRFGMDGVPGLLVDDGLTQRVLDTNFLFGHPDRLLAAIRAA